MNVYSTKINFYEPFYASKTHSKDNREICFLVKSKKRPCSRSFDRANIH